ncbi:TlpA family protein disulfide reductase [Helicobacter sp. Faydin-H64]|uniref:TlpA family protein disulfide reductase n=1 Tax=Helicobacter turcicus TaxID=2867412 RepID=A0ABS7JM33_9HELI|nr:TlpA family protein disulfide reductase [Helicobacter turcicus]MBX7545313.1 TlpA family protein disulfide reductase [Helicobacter turcicus]
MLFSACLLIFAGCEESTQEITTEATMPEKKQKLLENLTLQANNGETLVINQKGQKGQNEFAFLESKSSVLEDLSVTDVNGVKSIKILVFFTTWCDPCKGILPHLENLKNQFGDKIAFFGIPIDDLVGEMENFKGAVQVFSEENMLNIPLILDENRVELFRTLGGIEGVPLIAMYRENGEYIIHYLGAVPEEMIEFDLSQNLQNLEERQELQNFKEKVQ